MANMKSTNIALPDGWEKCHTGIKGVRKWRNLVSQSWVTEREDDPDMLHCGIRGLPIKIDSDTSSAEQTIHAIHAMTQK
jgi:hypothetical protein